MNKREHHPQCSIHRAGNHYDEQSYCDCGLEEYNRETRVPMTTLAIVVFSLGGGALGAALAYLTAIIVSWIGGW